MEKLLTTPDENGYVIAENKTVVSSQDLDGGLPRSRLDEIGGTRIITLAWSGSKKRYNTVKKFLQDNVGENCPQFLMDLIVSNGSYQEYVCNVIADSINISAVSNLSWSINANFEVIPRDDEDLYTVLPKLDSPDFSNYGFADQSNRTTVNYGMAGLHRRTLLNNEGLISVQWATDAAGYTELAKIYRSSIALGNLPFTCDLLLDKTETETYTCNFVVGSFSLQSVQGLCYNVTAQLQILHDNYDVVNNPWINNAALSSFSLPATTARYSLTVENVNLVPSFIEFLPEFSSYLFSAKDSNLTYNTFTPFKIQPVFASFVFSPSAIDGRKNAAPNNNYVKGAAWDAGANALTTSVAIVRCLPCQASGTIVLATIEGDIAGTCSVEVWNTSYAGAPATSANIISALAPISMTAAAKNQDSTLTGWTVAVTKGDIIVFKLISTATVKWLTCGVEIKPT